MFPFIRNYGLNEKNVVLTAYFLKHVLSSIPHQQPCVVCCRVNGKKIQVVEYRALEPVCR